MNPRVLELIRNPKSIRQEDLGLLKEEIHDFPYIQSIRALYLYGVHLYEKENYQKELSITAAYTTEKKILYQLINGKGKQESHSEIIEEKTSSKASNKLVLPALKAISFPKKEAKAPAKENSGLQKNACNLQAEQEAQHVYINGERNRILFEGEENFLNEKNPEIIEEAAQRSKALETQKTESKTEEPVHLQKEGQQIQEGKESEVFTYEVIIPKVQVTREKVEGEVMSEISDAELSFLGIDPFMPDVKIQGSKEKIGIYVEPQPNENKHEKEMRRLTEEVEKKMKETRFVQQEKELGLEGVEHHKINFEGTQSFHFWSKGQEESAAIKEESVHKETVAVQPFVEARTAEVLKEKEEIPEIHSVWKPMSVESVLMDSLISNPETASDPEIKISVVKEEPILGTIDDAQLISSEIWEPVEETLQEDALPVAETSVSEEEKNVDEVVKEEVPVINVSFFGTDISNLKVEEKIGESAQEIEVDSKKNTPAESNVPGFINTWQNWLKINRKEEIKREKSKIKERAIDTFIENNPKISQLKEESNYVVKEKNDDISHLMTETLANLYFEQKLYTKAINAFEILIKKNPDKKEYFEAKIKDIKDFRSKN